MNISELKANWLSKLVELKSASSKKRKRLLSEDTGSGLLRVLYQIARNIYYAYVPVTLKDRSLLLFYRKELRHLARSNTSPSARRRLLLRFERRGERDLLTSLLTPFIRALAATTI
ncbi:MAG: hypothetical protein GY696_07150 [Gammaproteobacteria bacterium]|nr:hypothetical protein [Gammaproteobacteria bacterium]